MKTFISALGAIVLGLFPLNAQFLINPYAVQTSGTSYSSEDSISGTTNGNNPVGHGGLNVVAVGNQFTPSSTYTITRIDIQAAKNGSPTQDYVCEIRDSVTNSPTTLVGSTSAVVNGASFPASEGTVTFYPTATVTSGTPYFICIRALAQDASNYILWYRISGVGQINTNNGATWTSASTARISKYETFSSP